MQQPQTADVQRVDIIERIDETPIRGYDPGAPTDTTTAEPQPATPRRPEVRPGRADPRTARMANHRHRNEPLFDVDRHPGRHLVANPRPPRPLHCDPSHRRYRNRSSTLSSRPPSTSCCRPRDREPQPGPPTSAPAIPHHPATPGAAAHRHRPHPGGQTTPPTRATTKATRSPHPTPQRPRPPALAKRPHQPGLQPRRRVRPTRHPSPPPPPASFTQTPEQLDTTIQSLRRRARGRRLRRKPPPARRLGRVRLHD